ncbi:MAG: hypothetical protein ISP82_03590 [Candidatus Poseidoniaceae archaeon]|nr:hypothetical protein [Candidatus Poseidoniaceae archaeon]MBL6895957.1 hypothetical protein [Candidatus Poseidoniaceae archaeon]
MTIISPDEYTLLMAAPDYERNLQAVNIGKKYGLTSNQILSMLPLKQPLGQQRINTTLPSTSNYRFEYDPSQDASQRRQQVSQAINCPGCGAALGIPAVRPIKVTCPQCQLESTFME